MITEKFPALADLSKEEKVLLAAELWADAEKVDEAPEPSDDTLKLLEERLNQFQSDPDSAVSWDEFRKTLEPLRND